MRKSDKQVVSKIINNSKQFDNWFHILSVWVMNLVVF